MKVLKKNEFQTGGLKTQDVPCPEFGEDAVIRLLELTADTALELSSKTPKDKQAEEGALLTWIIASAINEDGSPLFEEADRVWLGKKGVSLIMRLGQAALKLNGFDKAGNEDAAKN